MKILVSKLRALGDTVLLTSTVDLLMRQYPQAEITVLVPTAFKEVFDCNPQVREIWGYEDQGFLRLLGKIRREKFQMIFNFHASDRMLWLARFSGAKETHTQYHTSELHEEMGKDATALDWDPFFLGRAVSCWRASVANPPKIFLTEQERAWGHDFWQKRGAEASTVVFLGLGASRPTKIWPLESFARFAELLRDRLEFTPAIIFGPGDAEERTAATLLDHLRVKGFRPQKSAKDRGGVIFHAGLSVRELACVLAACRAYVGNDSGPKHVAAAVGTPTYTFFGPEDPQEWHPYSRTEHPLFFLPGLACRKEDDGRWCGIHTCVEERHRCMRSIDPLEVFEVFRRRVS